MISVNIILQFDSDIIDLNKSLKNKGELREGKIMLQPKWESLYELSDGCER